MFQRIRKFLRTKEKNESNNKQIIENYKEVIIPFYLNQRIIYDTLAIINDGFTELYNVSNSNNNCNNIEGNINAKLDDSKKYNFNNYYNELNNYLVENKDAIIYVSKLNDESIRLFENKFKNIINKNNLNNKILYLDLTEELKENNIVKEINKKYGKEMTEVPTIVIIKDGKISSSYNIKENKYNIKLLEKYLEKEDVIND